MANNYLQFSEEISNTTPEERAWFDKIYNLEPGIDTYDGPEGLDLNEEEVDRLGWGFDFSHGDEGTWINAEESGDPDLVGKVVHTFIKKFRPNYTFRLTWAETCSSMRIGQFSGGCLVVDKDGYEAISAWTLADCSSKVLKEICNLMEKPMPIPVWKCAVCPTIHRSEEDAYKCEKQHRCYEEFKITAAIYSDNSGLYGQSLTVNQTVPNRIRVRFSARGDDHGLYQLISYGPRGI